MCGRYVLYNSSSAIKAHFDLDTIKNYNPSYNIAPGQYAAIINKSRNLDLYRWGFTPEWSKKPIINSRSETVLQKEIFKQSLISRRCIVPNSGWFEWKDNKPYYIKSKESDIIGFAGIWTVYENINKYVILTRTSHGKIASLHSRAPIILKKLNYNKWLYGSVKESMEAACYSYECDFDIKEVSKDINSIKNDNYNLICSI